MRNSSTKGAAAAATAEQRGDDAKPTHIRTGATSQAIFRRSRFLHGDGATEESSEFVEWCHTRLGKPRTVSAQEALVAHPAFWALVENLLNTVRAAQLDWVLHGPHGETFFWVATPRHRAVR